MLDLNEIAEESHKVLEQRIKNGAKIGQNLKHCATEVVEAVEARELYREFPNTGNLEEFGKELADIIICVLNEAYENEINIEGCIRMVMEKNKARAELKGDKI